MLMDNTNVISVSQLNFYLKSIIDSNPIFNNIYVKGEISNLKYHPSGHIYFSLKDEDGLVKCVMFSTYTSKLDFRLNEGDKIIVNGSLSIYSSSGTYQIYVKNITKDGLGNLYLEFEKLKKELKEKGLFDESHKKPIPSYPFNIGIISGKTGAGLRDVISILKRRWPIANIIVFPCLVQGKEAPKSIIKALNDSLKFELDVLILARGGGSQEDLFCFNDKELAYAIYNYSVPIVCGVGHEIDFTIADFVSDLRASTPSSAAEIVTRDINVVLEDISRLKSELIKETNNLVDEYKNVLLEYNSFLNKDYLDKVINNKRLLLNNCVGDLKNSYLEFSNKLKNNIILNRQQLINSYTSLLDNKKNEYMKTISLLDSVSPLKVLSRGYSVVSNSNGNVSSVNDVNVNDVIRIRLKDGKIYAVVTRKDDNDGK